MFRISILTLILFTSTLFAQIETITNRTVIEMSKAGLSNDIILKKIGSSSSSFDVSAPKLIELKTAGVNDTVIAAMIDRTETDTVTSDKLPAQAYSESDSPPTTVTRQDVMTAAKTIAFGKSSLQPSRQALEKELMKRTDFQQLNITILRYKEQADLFVDIGFVSGSLITHRYVYRIYDRRTGAVITAGETTSWGSLAENLARHISKSLVAARAGRMS